MWCVMALCVYSPLIPTRTKTYELSQLCPCNNQTALFLSRKKAIIVPDDL